MGESSATEVLMKHKTDQDQPSLADHDLPFKF